MSLWIRSQNKKELIQCDNFSLNYPDEFYTNNTRLINNYEIVCYPFEHSHCILGEYSTEEKALEVLDMIETHLEDLEYKIHNREVVFQMPDDEVE